MKNIKNIIIIISTILFISPLAVNAKIEKETVKLVKCVDGDTAQFLINNKKKKTRFLAINTPESVHPTKEVEPFGKESSSYTCDKLTNAKTIVLEYDENAGKEDKYGRLLAWIFVDGELLQKDLISKGYAEVAYLYGDYKYTEELKEEQTKAQNNKLGIWSTTTNQDETKANETTTSTKTEKTSEYDAIFKQISEIFKKLATKLLKKLENMI